MMIKLIYLLFTLVAQSELLVIADDNHFVGHNDTKDPTVGAQEALTNNLSDPSEKHVGQDRKLADFTFYVYEQGSQGEDNGGTRKHPRSDSIAQSDTTIHTHENHHHHHEHHHHYNAVSSNEGRGSNIGVADNLRIGSNDYDHVRKDDSIDTNDSRSHQDSSSDSRSGSYGHWSDSYDGWGKGWHSRGSSSGSKKGSKGSSSGSYVWGKGWHGSKKGSKGSWSGSDSNGGWGGHSKPKPSPGHRPRPEPYSRSSPSRWSGGWGGRSSRSRKSSNEEYRNSYGESNDDTRVVKEGSSRIPDSSPTSDDRSSVASNSSITSGNSRINQNATIDTDTDDIQTDNITKKPTRDSFPFTPSPSSETINTIASITAGSSRIDQNATVDTAIDDTTQTDNITKKSTRNSFPFTPSPSSETTNDMASGSNPTNTTTNITSNSSNARVPTSFIYSSPTIVSNRTDTSTKPASSVNATQGL